MNNFSKKILITGSSGFIGRNLKQNLDNNYQIIALASQNLNLLDSEKVHRFLKKHRFDTVVHCATHNATITSDKNTTLVFKNNLKMFFNLARCNSFYTRMFYFGSGAEYDKSRSLKKVKENFFDINMPRDDYGFSKYIMTKCVQNIPNIYNLRLFGCFGKYEDWRIRFISQACCRAVLNMDIVINQNVYFDYLYINDLIKIVDFFIQAKKIPYNSYNIASGEPISLQKIAVIIKKISGKNLKIKVIKKGLNLEYTADNSLLKKFMPGFKPTPIEKSIKDLYNWYSQNKKKINKNQFVLH